MVAANKQRKLMKLVTLLHKSYSPDLPKDFTVLDHLLLACIQEGMSFSKSVDIFRQLIQSFHDLNEIRVSHVDEVVERLGGVTNPQVKAKRIIQILQFVFETTYSYDLEQMRRKPLKQAQKQLSKIQGTDPFIINATVQRSLNGHALPIDEQMVAVLKQLEIVDEEESSEQMQSGLEHIVPKAKGLAFCLQLSELAFDSSKHQKELLKPLLPATPAKPKAAKPKTTKASPAPRKSDKKAAKRK